MTATSTSNRRAGVPSSAASPPAHPRGTELTGTWRLVRLALRRDRVLLSVWLGVLVALLAASVASVVALYETAADRLQYATVAATSVVARAFDGPMSGTSLGAVVMTETFGILALLTGIMCVQALVRHTRLEEETGRAELVGSAVVGRHARLVAALLVVLGAAVVLGVAAALTLAGMGLPVAGSVLAGAALAGVGAVFAGVAAVAVQVSETSRGANGIGIAAVGVAFLLRAVGDATGTLADSGVEVVSAWPSWLSPIGWGQQARPFGGDHWWVLALFALAVVLLAVVAFVLTAHRDVGAGMVAPRPGPARAAPRLLRPSGLVLRLQRTALLGWAIGLAAIAAAFGGITDEVEAILETSDELVALLEAMGGSEVLVDLYAAFALGVLAFAAGAYLVSAVLRARTEEAEGRAEPLLATAVGRSRYLGAHVGWAVVGGCALLLLIGVVGGTAAALTTGDGMTVVGDFVLAAIVHAPAVLVLGAVAVVAVGWLPRFAAALSWGAVVASVVIGQFGALFDLPQAVLHLSPFTHVPAVPAEDVRVLPLAALTLVALVLGAVGFAGWRRRDVDC